MLHSLASIITVSALLLTGLWFVYSRNERMYDKLVYWIMAIVITVQFCVLSYIMGAERTFEALKKSPSYELPTWYATASENIGGLSVLIAVVLIGLSYLFGALNKNRGR